MLEKCQFGWQQRHLKKDLPTVHQAFADRTPLDLLANKLLLLATFPSLRTSQDLSPDKCYRS